MSDWVSLTSGKPHLVELVEGATEHRSLAAAGGHGALRELLLPVDYALAFEGGHVDLLAVPVDLHRPDVLDVLDEPLVAEIAQGEGFGPGAQSHQGHDLPVVDLDGERELAGHPEIAGVAVLVDGADRVGRGEPGPGHRGAVWPGGGIHRSGASIAVVAASISPSGAGGVCASRAHPDLPRS